jgi:glycosyltransferase involved in cell wall biosynthesis
MDIGVIPFIKDNDYNKAKSPTKLFEFMSCAKPCITSPIGEMNSIIESGKNGYLAENREKFIEYIKLLAGDQDLRKKVGLEARKTIEQRYSLESCGKSFFENLKEAGII